MDDVTIIWPDPGREAAFHAWLSPLADAHALDVTSLRPASSDASFRRYLRLDGARGSRIVMDAPPAQEDCAPFVHVAGLLHDAGLHAPQVLAWSRELGFMLLSDLGNTTYLQRLDAGNARALYDDASVALVRLQGIEAQGVLPPYDGALLTRELQLFPEWYVGRHCGVHLDDAQRAALDAVFQRLLANNLAQPCVMVHRDWHSRNLMVCDPNPGILDFQDAVWGPVTYDLVSMLRDAYVEWDEERQIDIAVRHWERARKAGLPVQADFGEFWRDVEWMGLQRHLKVLGIFARLFHRDGKDAYLADMPRVWRYAHHAATRYRELGSLALLLEQLAGTRREVGYTF